VVLLELLVAVVVYGLVVGAGHELFYAALGFHHGHGILDLLYIEFNGLGVLFGRCI
jgi:hypothetical protein